ncbi:hypothetical protein P153DRAFT_274627, partial [Dothidotthia symphoricarpi CBS 119687]
MLPPVDPAVLQRNPNFEVLYQDLTARKLNGDGSTRDTKKQRMHDEIGKSFTTARRDLLSSQILIKALSDLPAKTSTLPPELHTCIEIVTAQLSGHIPPSDREILSSEITFFLDNISMIADIISHNLTRVADVLCTITDPTNPPPIPDLTTRATTLHKTATNSHPHALHTSRITLINTASSLLATHRSLLESSIRILEQTQHGALARHTKSRAELLHSRATLLGLQAKIHACSHPPPAEFVAALKEFRRLQGVGEKALRNREALARSELALYERAGEKGMRDLARRKGELEREIGRVEGEV